MHDFYILVFLNIMWFEYRVTFASKRLHQIINQSLNLGTLLWILLLCILWVETFRCKCKFDHTWLCLTNIIFCYSSSIQLDNSNLMQETLISLYLSSLNIFINLVQKYTKQREKVTHIPYFLDYLFIRIKDLIKH